MLFLLPLVRPPLLAGFFCLLFLYVPSSLLNSLAPSQAAITSCLYIATGTLSEILTNNAAAALMYPIASAAGDKLGEA